MNEEIGTVVPRGNAIYVYNMMGFTSSTVSIKRNSLIYIYNAKGQQVSTVGA